MVVTPPGLVLPVEEGRGSMVPRYPPHSSACGVHLTSPRRRTFISRQSGHWRSAGRHSSVGHVIGPNVSNKVRRVLFVCSSSATITDSIQCETSLAGQVAVVPANIMDIKCQLLHRVSAGFESDLVIYRKERPKIENTLGIRAPPQERDKCPHTCQNRRGRTGPGLYSPLKLS